ncbi:MAG: hypothetical protein GC154_10770 [bacterium]|nr:hypothetical protein [bacterium]
MDKIQNLIKQIFENDLDDDARNSIQTRMAQWIHASAFADFSSHPLSETFEPASQSAAASLIRKIEHLKSQNLTASAAQKRIESAAASAARGVFYTPELVRFLYDPYAAPDDPLIVRGVDIHCQLIRRAVRNVATRYADSIQRAMLDRESVEEELWSAAMEEIVRCLSDLSARAWRAESSEPVCFPPEGARGWKKALAARVALNPSGDRIAILQSDRMLSIWNIPDGELLRKQSLAEFGDSTGFEHWSAPYFSLDGERIAVQTAAACVIVVDLNGKESIDSFTSDRRDDFRRGFGQPYLPDEARLKTLPHQVMNRKEESLSWPDYLKQVYHAACDGDQRLAASASEIERFMPGWMCDIGFENAVYYILRRRLIDRIRKEIHVESAAAPGVDGSQPQTDEAETAPRTWGVYSFNKTIDDMSAGESVTHSSRQTDDWREEHDLERILAVLRNVSITYKKQRIPCDRLARLKAEGGTNAEIGEALGVPRGTVDYLWNQCRNQIQLIFGDEI